MYRGLRRVWRRSDRHGNEFAGAIVRNLISSAALLAIAAWLACALIGSDARPPTGVGYEVIAQTSTEGRTFVVRDTTIAPGGAIGWHWHPGTVIAVVKQGTLYHYGNDCTVDGIYRPGDSFIELSGPAHVHDGRNRGTTSVVLELLLIDPVGTSPAEAADPPRACR
ncbi:cupin domain-containing protein [Mycobacterium sp. E735]|uniref:cupin domain-containing protein n=1 Tax=Mycobacterium sp. E735 TaxID=1834148 RepID=UPI000B1A0962|nr:cupin domain-containing protein [Mycobacterium sp. E735]